MLRVSCAVCCECGGAMWLRRARAASIASKPVPVPMSSTTGMGAPCTTHTHTYTHTYIHTRNTHAHTHTHKQDAGSAHLTMLANRATHATHPRTLLLLSCAEIVCVAVHTLACSDLTRAMTLSMANLYALFRRSSVSMSRYEEAATSSEDASPSPPVPASKNELAQ